MQSGALAGAWWVAHLIHFNESKAQVECAFLEVPSQAAASLENVVRVCGAV